MPTPLSEAPLTSIMNAIRVELGAVPVDQASESDATSILWYEGRRFQVAQTRPPRYVWHPIVVRPGPPYKGDIGQRVAVASGLEGVQVTSWGADLFEAWKLRHNFLSAGKKLCASRMEYLGCEPVEPNDTTYGYAYITRVAFHIPIIDELFDVLTPTTVNTQGVIIIGTSETVSCGGIPP
jgi:hypothetical protein